MLILLYLFSMSSVLATEIYYQDVIPQKLEIKVVKVDPSSNYLSIYASNVFDLVGANGITHQIVCNEKLRKDQKTSRSYFSYHNISGVHVADFVFF